MANRISSFLNSIVSMSDYMDLQGAGISIRKNIYFRGPNVFILACAIIIASVGLNVNSIPVIIGAMLISPVMGPILGFGFSLGVFDRQLLKDSLRNFVVMVVISILASTLYFLLSPLKMEHPTELLARTNPTVYDVLIALFGGFAGILESSRKEKGMVLSGVAIATALMPPLCTIGYGISILKPAYILGATYLFLINSVFIALATFIGVKYLGYKPVSDVPGSRSALTGRAVALVLLIMIVPSVISAIDIIKDSNFRIHASRFAEENKSIGKGFIYDYEISTSSDPSTITLYMAGEQLNVADKERMYASAAEHGLFREQIIIHDEATNQKDGITDSEIFKSVMEHTDRQIQTLRDSIATLNARIAAYRSLGLDSLLTR